MNQKQLLQQAIEHRHLIFELKKRKKIQDTIIPIGIAKFNSIIGFVNRCRKRGEQYDILEIITLSRKELRKGIWNGSLKRY